MSSKSDDDSRARSSQAVCLPTRSRVQSYLQLTRLHTLPLGTELVFWPFAWGLLMSIINPVSGRPLSVQAVCGQTIVFGVISTLVHAMACVVNDICDVNFDGRVERTKKRPLVTGAVSLSGAWTAVFIMFCALLGMLRFVNSSAGFSLLLGFGLSTIYPLMKRWTWWPQLYLGFTVNWGLWVGWLSSVESLHECPIRPSLSMFLGLICWTLVYDTIYACQDRPDDIKAGVKSTAVLFGDHVRLVVAFFALAFVSLLWLSGTLNGNGLWYFVLSCGGTACHLLWQLATWDVSDAKSCAIRFKANGHIGFLVFAGLCLDYFSSL